MWAGFFFSKSPIVKPLLGKTVLQERRLVHLCYDQKMASEFNIEQVMDEFKTLVPIKRKLEL